MLIIGFLLLLQSVTTQSERIDGGQITVVRDPYHQQTITRLEPLTASDTKLYVQKSISAKLGIQLVEQKEQRQFVILIEADSPRGIFTNERDVAALTDQQAFQFGQAERRVEIRYASIREWLACPISEADFNRLMKAQTLSFKAGQIELTVNEKRFKAWRIFHQRTHTPS